MLYDMLTFVLFLLTLVRAWFFVKFTWQVKSHLRFNSINIPNILAGFFNKTKHQRNVFLLLRPGPNERRNSSERSTNQRNNM